VEKSQKRKKEKKKKKQGPGSSYTQERETAQQSTPSSSDAVTTPPPVVSTEQENAGTLIVDLTVAPADIAYPTDIELLNTAREKTEHLIDVLYATLPKEQKTEKPRTYRKKARRDHLAIAKQRKRSIKSIRKALRKQLGYVGRNIKTIHKLLEVTPDGLCCNDMKLFWFIQELYRQQKEMYDTKTHRISDRIVSVSQPHVRPIVRGKAKATTEFGAQVSVSIMNGFRRVHNIQWDAYNEGSDLPEQIEQYKVTYGHYPAIVLADRKYGTKDNRTLMKEKGIVYGGTPLGRPRKDGSRGKMLPKEIVNQRNHVEGTLGIGKRSYGLDCIKARRIDTSGSWIAMIFLVMNLPLIVKSLGTLFLSYFVNALDRYVQLKMTAEEYVFAQS
jgi:transposase, IS5 family